MTPRAALAAVLVAALAGCAQLKSVSPLSKGRSSLNEGIRHYNDGRHLAAAKSLQAALDLGLSDTQSAELAAAEDFIHCSTGRTGPCRDEFRMATNADPNLTLAPAEAGHPVWGPIFASLKGGPAPFKLALQQYEAGDYAASAKNFQGAINEGLSDKQLANAHKHLAFIHCSANRQKQCRDEFKKALKVDPALELEPAEASHPVWGPIFKSVKAGG